MTTETEDRLANARAQGQAQFDSIVEMVETLQQACLNGENREQEEAEQAIHEDALSVEVRGGWHTPGNPEQGGEAEEYRILLCTGGPAVQIVGALSEHGEPITAHLMVQDWGTLWTEFRPLSTSKGESMRRGDAEKILLAYARCFWFGV
jgi:hypothetical protein